MAHLGTPGERDLFCVGAAWAMQRLIVLASGALRCRLSVWRRRTRRGGGGPSGRRPLS